METGPAGTSLPAGPKLRESDTENAMTTAWTLEHLRQIAFDRIDRVPAIASASSGNLDSGRVYWDMWPVQDESGHIASPKGRELWMALTAPDRGNPNLRHFEAKIRLLERLDGTWIDRGNVLPNFDVDYEREWAGSAVAKGDDITLYFTAAGTHERSGGYQQRLFEAHGKIGEDGLPCDWQPPVPSITAISADYMAADAHDGEAGKIKAFRDPAYFRDPADGSEYLIFTASLADSTSDFNGAVGIARKGEAGWELLPPLVHADGVNNELERAHVVFHHGRYYVFWVTQGITFAPDAPDAPNGLYGMVSDRLLGDYRPLNGSGLVLANPDDEPVQSYSWFVSAELVASSFVDFFGLNGRALPSDPVKAKAFFGGVPAPLLQLAIDEDGRTTLKSKLP